MLASDGAGGIEWRALESGGGGLVPSLAEVMGVGGTAGADLDMGEFDITKSSQLGIDAPLISLSGTVSFTDIPLCSVATDATQSEQLVSKGYVDGAISQVVISSGGVGVMAAACNARQSRAPCPGSAANFVWPLSAQQPQAREKNVACDWKSLKVAVPYASPVPQPFSGARPPARPSEWRRPRRGARRKFLQQPEQKQRGQQQQVRAGPSGLRRPAVTGQK